MNLVRYLTGLNIEKDRSVLGRKLYLNILSLSIFASQTVLFYQHSWFKLLFTSVEASFRQNKCINLRVVRWICPFFWQCINIYEALNQAPMSGDYSKTWLNCRGGSYGWTKMKDRLSSSTSETENEFITVIRPPFLSVSPSSSLVHQALCLKQA